MTAPDPTSNPTPGRPTALWLLAFLLLLALLQLALLPLLGGRDLELAPLFRVDSLGLLFGIAWTLTLAVISTPLARQGKRGRLGLYLGSVCLGFLVCAYAQNMASLAVGWALAGVAIWAVHNELLAPAPTNGSLLLAFSPGIVLAIMAVATGLPAFTPPTGGVAAPWSPVAAMGGALAVVLSTGWGELNSLRRAADDSRQVPNTPLTELYALAAPYILAKMLVAAPWQPVGAWLLVLLGMLTVLSGVYRAYDSRWLSRTRSLTYVLIGISLVGFGIAPGSPLAAAGAVWVMLAGLLRLVLHGWRWAQATALLAALPGLWLVSQAALDTGYGVVAALLLPAFVLLAWLITSYTPTRSRALHWVGAIPFTLAILAVAAPQLILEALVRPAVRTMAGGVGALTGVAVDWGVGMLMRTSQGTTPAALPSTGIALAVFLASVALYWLKQLAGRVTRPTGGDAQPE